MLHRGTLERWAPTSKSWAFSTLLLCRYFSSCPSFLKYVILGSTVMPRSSLLLTFPTSFLRVTILISFSNQSCEPPPPNPAPPKMHTTFKVLFSFVGYVYSQIISLDPWLISPRLIFTLTPWLITFPFFSLLLAVPRCNISLPLQQVLASSEHSIKHILHGLMQMLSLVIYQQFICASSARFPVAEIKYVNIHFFGIFKITV